MEEFEIPENVDFAYVRRGYDPKQVRTYSEELKTLVQKAQEEISTLQDDLRLAERQLDQAKALDEETLTEHLGTSAARLLNAARVEADLKEKEAEEEAHEILKQAKQEASEVHARAEKAFSERLEAAHAEAEKIQLEAQSIRHKTLEDMSRRRREANVQLERLRAGRDQLMDSFEASERVIDETKRNLNQSLAYAKIAADNAARQARSQPIPTPAELEEEIAAAKLLDLPQSNFFPDIGKQDTEKQDIKEQAVGYQLIAEEQAPKIDEQAIDEQIAEQKEYLEKSNDQIEESLKAVEAEMIKVTTLEKKEAEEKGKESGEGEGDGDEEIRIEPEPQQELEPVAEPPKLETIIIDADPNEEEEKEGEEESISPVSSNKWSLFRRKQEERLPPPKFSETSLADAQYEEVRYEEAKTQAQEVEAQTQEVEKPEETQSLFERLKSEQAEKAKQQSEAAPLEEEEGQKEEPEEGQAEEEPEEQISEVPEELVPEAPEIEEPEMEIEPEPEIPETEIQANQLALVVERQLKQALAVDQNYILDTLRQRRKKQLPPIGEQITAYVEAVDLTELNETTDSNIHIPDDLILKLWVEPLRAHLVKCFGDDVADPQKEVRNAYRNFKQNDCTKISENIAQQVLSLVNK